MSAINGIAGAMTEQVKVIHVVGQTTRTMHKDHMMIHHSIGFNPDHQIYNKASKGFRVAEAELNDVKTAPAEIDVSLRCHLRNLAELRTDQRVIRECFIKSCPVYIFIPLDMVDEEVPEDLLQTPLDLEPHSDENAVKDAIAAIIETLSQAKNPAVFVDCLIQRWNATKELKELVERLQLPVYASNMGKGLIDETNPLYVGIYNGAVSSPGLAETFAKTDLVLQFGNLPCDTNTGGFSRKIDATKCIDFRPTEVEVSALSRD